MPRFHIFLTVFLAMIILFVPFRIYSQNVPGDIIIKIDENDSLRLKIRTALLYRNVQVKFDSTLLIQTEDTVQIKYYPQLEMGNQNVLRILAGDFSETKTDFYDIFVVLGDSIPGSMTWQNKESNVFITYNGFVRNDKVSGRNIDGKISFDRDKKDKVVSGSIFLELIYPLFKQPPEHNRIVLRGKFNLTVGEYREINLSQLQSDKEKESKSRQNLYLGIIFSIFLIAIFGFS
ncbi:MAG: hypothetical protein JXL67_13890 [Calditrichaeota bacterium]|nr:hypothetical protein [Calditrichota bacterium]